MASRRGNGNTGNAFFRRKGLMPDPAYPGSWIPDDDRREKLVPVAAAVVKVLGAQPGIGVRKLRASVRNILGRCTDADTDGSLSLLGNGLERGLGTRGAHQYSVALDRVPPDVRSHLTMLEGAANKT
jgi:hypothetical protein